MNKVWLYAVVAGIFPALFWIFFWMREDRDSVPEPKILVLKTFLAGAIVAFIALASQALIVKFHIAEHGSDLGIILFAFIEEFFKFLVVYKIALKTNFNNERMDPVLYMIVGALGFSAAENIFYLIDYINDSMYIQSMIDGSYRFIGATLLHTISSAFIGITCSIFFFKQSRIRIFFVFLGLAIATVMHAIFNFLVVSGDEFYKNIAFYGSWGSIIFLLIIFEYLRHDWRTRPRTSAERHLFYIWKKKL